MLQETYEVQEVANLFAVGYNTVLNKIHSGDLHAKNLNEGSKRPRWGVTPSSLIDFLAKNPKWLWLLQQNIETGGPQVLELLSTFKWAYPNLAPAYSYTEVAVFVDRTRRWYVKQQSRGGFSGSYIFKDEFLRFLQTHPRYVVNLKRRASTNKQWELMRVELLTRLTEKEQK